jgi:hypothetical protein
MHLALVLNGMSENLGYLEWWWLGGIYSPQPPHSRWGGCLLKGAPDNPMRHRTLSDAPPDTVRCASHVTQPLGFWWFRSLELCLHVALDSPVLHRTGTVHYPVRL